MMSHAFDIAIVGSGFGGSLLAMAARRLGRSVVLLEKGRHPRFAIGESSTPLANLLLEEIATRYDLPRLLPFTKWGSWQRERPEVACGLKRGFSFYHHTLGEPFGHDPDHEKQLLVAASPHDGIADTHWYRPDFDHFFMREARKMGADYHDNVCLSGVSWEGGTAVLRGQQRGEPVQYRARFVADATGPRGFLHRALNLTESPPKYLPPTQALFSHFENVGLWEDVASGDGEAPPYPVDDAALHHVFDGGWMWVLRFNNGLTSAGFAVGDGLARELRLEEGAGAWERLLDQLPSVREQFAHARPTMPFIHAPRVSFRSEKVAGDGWALLPSAAGFIDPLLSTGFPLTLLGIARLAEAIEKNWGSLRFPERLREYESQTLEELDAAERLVSALYSSMDDFSTFAALSRLYFAAASFTETARRLNRPHLAGGFLLHDHPVFGPASRACFEKARAADRAELHEEIRRAVEPVDVVGLNRSDRVNWYPVDAADLLGVAGKVGSDRAEIERMLQRAGFYASL
jgi:FADH2 O2-dependent halogenase